MKRRDVLVGLTGMSFLGVAALTPRGGTVTAQTGAESTIEAQATRIAELEGTVSARGEKINAQRTQIAELKNPQPTATEATSADGSPVDSFGVWDVSVDQIILYDVVGGDVNTHTALGVFAVVYLTVTNTGNGPGSFPERDVRLVDDAGRQYSYALEPTVSYFIYNLGGGFQGDQQPGLPTPVPVVFDIPVDMEIVSITDESRSLYLQAPEPIPA